MSCLTVAVLPLLEAATSALPLDPATASSSEPAWISNLTIVSLPVIEPALSALPWFTKGIHVGTRVDQQLDN